MIGIDIGDGEIKCFRQTKPHAVDDKDVTLKAGLASGVDHVRDFVVGENIGEFFLYRWFDDFDPVPLSFEDVAIEELQAAAIGADSAPGVSL